MNEIQQVELTHRSPEFDAAYDVLRSGISPAYLETRDFLRNRLRVRDEGPKSEQEKLLVQDGYTLHCIAAVRRGAVVGAIYGHLISPTAQESRSAGFVTYICVHADYRKRGIGRSLIREVQRIVDDEAVRLTGKPILGMFYEIEQGGKEEIKATVSKLGARPLDVVYYQPALHPGSEPERMDLWFQPIQTLPAEEIDSFTLRRDDVHDLVRSMLVMEYVGPDLKGFDLSSTAYSAFTESIKDRQRIGFKPVRMG